MRTVTVYRRDGCHLCDEALDALRPIAAEAGNVVIEEVDIETDDELFKAYLERIPVIELDGRVIGELVPNTRSLRSTLLKESAR